MILGALAALSVVAVLVRTGRRMRRVGGGADGRAAQAGAYESAQWAQAQTSQSARYGGGGL